MEWWNAALPVVSVIIGYGGTLLTESRRDARARSLAATERSARLVEDRAIERRKFELGTLTETQRALAVLVRAAGKAHHFDVMAAKQAGDDNYPVSQLPADLSDGAFDANSDLARLEGLLISDDARSKVAQFRGSVATLGAYQGTVSGADRLMLDIVAEYEHAVEAVTARIRGIYDGTVTF